MDLLLDLGNTRLKFAIFEGSDLLIEGILSDLSTTSIQGIPHFNQLDKILVSTVIDLPADTVALILPKRVNAKPELKSSQYALQSLGEDRKYLAIAGGPNSLVICLGTCITYNATNEDGEFWAGAISPGLGMRAKAMSSGTAKLPEVNLEPNYLHWGTDTQSNLLAGVMAGVEFEILGFVGQIKKVQPHVQIILTGGDASYYSHLFPIDEHLQWKGMLQVIK